MTSSELTVRVRRHPPLPSLPALLTTIPSLFSVRGFRGAPSDEERELFSLPSQNVRSGGTKVTLGAVVGEKVSDNHASESDSELSSASSPDRTSKHKRFSFGFVFKGIDL